MSSTSESHIKRLSRGLRMMYHTMRPRIDNLTLPEILYTDAGDEYHIYYPRGKALRTVIVVYCMSI